MRASRKRKGRKKKKDSTEDGGTFYDESRLLIHSGKKARGAKHPSRESGTKNRKKKSGWGRRAPKGTNGIRQTGKKKLNRKIEMHEQNRDKKRWARPPKRKTGRKSKTHSVPEKERDGYARTRFNANAKKGREGDVTWKKGTGESGETRARLKRMNKTEGGETGEISAKPKKKKIIPM